MWAEIENMRRLKHKNIIGYLSDFEHNNRQCIVMEYIGSKSLKEFLDQRVTSSLEVVLLLKTGSRSKGCLPRDLGRRELHAFTKCDPWRYQA